GLGHAELGGPAAFQPTGDRGVEDALEGGAWIRQQRVHAEGRQLDDAVIIAQAGSIAGGTGDAAHQAGDGDSHDGGGDEHFEEGESARGSQGMAHGMAAHWVAHWLTTLSTRGKPVMGSRCTVRWAWRRLPNWMEMPGTVAPGMKRTRRGWAGSAFSRAGRTPSMETPSGILSSRVKPAS